MTIYKMPIDNLPTLTFDFYQMFFTKWLFYQMTILPNDYFTKWLFYQMTILPNDYYYCVEGIEMRQLGCKVGRHLFLKR